ncbi:MAG: PQQ-binding-like beta-propeller repeat protein [Ignavibacteriales bacterium]|nr:PQQ-binding-like beta-propeller repeat protein [Ignavibacteriales bacterium]
MKKILSAFIIIVLTSIGYSQSELKFAWLTDIHVGYPTAGEDLQRSVDDINSLNDISFTIISGDITATGTLEELSLAKLILDNLEKPYYIIPGNHDTKWSESGSTDFIRLWGKDRFTFEFNKFLFIGLHQGPRMRMADGHWAPEDLRWFDSLIVSLPNSNQPIIFITHYPLNEEIDNWYEMLDRLKNINTQVALFGHGHRNKIYDFESIKGIMGRSNLRANEKIGGYTIAEIKNDSIYFSERTPNISTTLWHSLKLQQRNYEALITEQSRPDYSINEKYPNVKTVWEFNSGYTIGSSAVIKNNSVFIGDASGYFYSLSLLNGSVNWKFKSQNDIYSTSAVKCNYVVFGSADSSIYCLNAKNGTLIWKYKTNAAVLGSPTIEDDVVYIGGSDKIFRAIDLESGKLIWEFKSLNGFIETKPAFYDDKILFGAWDEHFYCLDAETGKLIWKWKSDRNGTFYSPAACWSVASDGIVFFAAPDRKLTAINIETGNQLWRTAKYKVRETVGLSEDGEKLFIRTMNDSILALPVSEKLKEPLWVTNCGFGYDISSAQIVEKDGVIFYPTKNGMIYSLDSESGKIIWQHKISNGFVNTVTPINNHQIITTDFDGKVKLIKSSE